MLQLCSFDGNELLNNPKGMHEMWNVLTDPKELPPPRSHDCRIPLKKGSQFVNIRPYSFPTVQKTVVEQLLKEMLATGIIHPCCNPTHPL